MKFPKTTFAIAFLAALTIIGSLTSLVSAEDENELFLVAQKAYDDGFYDVATRYINQYLEKYPQAAKRVQANLLLGQCYFFKGQYLKAFDIFQSLLPHTEFKDITLFWLGETYLKGSDYLQAENQYRQLIDLFPDSVYAPQALYSLGWALFDQKKYDDAKKIFQDFLTKYPEHEVTEDGYFKMAECDYQLRNYPATIEALQKYLTNFPQSNRLDQVYFYMAESYYYSDDFKNAAENYAKAIEISQDNKILLSSKISIGWCHFKLKDLVSSLQSFEEAQKFSQEKSLPSDDVDLGLASLYFATEEYQKALEAYDHLLTATPGSPRILETYIGKANTLYVLRNYPEAISLYQSIIDQYAADPNQRENVENAFFGLAWTYLKNNDIEKSIATFQEVVTRTSNVDAKVSALSQIGDAYQDLGQLDKALETYDKILKEYPNSIFADYIQYRQAIALLKQNNIDAAAMSFQSLLNNFPTSKYLSDTKYYLGLAYFKKGDWAGARDHLSSFLQYVSLNSEFQTDALFTLGLSLFNLQDYAEASKAFYKVIKNFPDQTILVSNCEVNIAKCMFYLEDPKEAAKKFKIIAYKYPGSEAEQDSLLWLGDYYLGISDYENATTYYQQFVDSFPGSAKIHQARFGLGQTFQAKGMLDQAINEFKLIKESPDSELYAKAQLAIADIFSEDADPDSAIESYQKITVNSPEFSRDAYLKIAETHKSNQDYPNALAAYQKAIETEGGLSNISNAEIQFAIADLFETLNQPKEATDALLKIPYLYPNESRWVIKSYLRLGRIFEKAEDWDNAKIAYNKILDFNIDESKFAQERLEWINANAKPAIQ